MRNRSSIEKPVFSLRVEILILCSAIGLGLRLLNIHAHADDASGLEVLVDEGTPTVYEELDPKFLRPIRKVPPKISEKNHQSDGASEVKKKESSEAVPIPSTQVVPLNVIPNQKTQSGTVKTPTTRLPLRRSRPY